MTASLTRRRRAPAATAAASGSLSELHCDSESDSDSEPPPGRAPLPYSTTVTPGPGGRAAQHDRAPHGVHSHPGPSTSTHLPDGPGLSAPLRLPMPLKVELKVARHALKVRSKVFGHVPSSSTSLEQGMSRRVTPPPSTLGWSRQQHGRVLPFGGGPRFLLAGSPSPHPRSHSMASRSAPHLLHKVSPNRILLGAEALFAPLRLVLFFRL